VKCLGSIPRWTALVAVAVLTACSGPPTTATGPQSGPNDPITPTQVRYALLVDRIDTTTTQSNTVLTVTLRVRTQAGLAVVAAEVDLGVTQGQVSPQRTFMAPDGTVTAYWDIPPGRMVANLYGCARPPGQECATGPLFKWNQ